MAAVEGSLRYCIEQPKRRDHGAGREHLDLEVAAGHVVDLPGVVLGVFVENVFRWPRALPAHVDRALGAYHVRGRYGRCSSGRGRDLEEIAPRWPRNFGRFRHGVPLLAFRTALAP